jgi:hypothetical protein
MTPLQLKALDIAARQRLRFQDGTWLVPSQTTNRCYHVMLSPGGNRCTCDDFTLRGCDCKHILAAQFVQ